MPSKYELFQVGDIVFRTDFPILHDFPSMVLAKHQGRVILCAFPVFKHDCIKKWTFNPNDLRLFTIEDKCPKHASFVLQRSYELATRYCSMTVRPPFPYRVHIVSHPDPIYRFVAIRDYDEEYDMMGKVRLELEGVAGAVSNDQRNGDDSDEVEDDEMEYEEEEEEESEEEDFDMDEDEADEEEVPPVLPRVVDVSEERSEEEY